MCPAAVGRRTIRRSQSARTPPGDHRPFVVLCCTSVLAVLSVHTRGAMTILRHSWIDLIMEIYTQVADAVAGGALNKLSDELDQGK
jgi:hypothetical protein